MNRKYFLYRYFVKIRNLIDLNRGSDTTDVQGTINYIKKSIQIRGANIWILICGSLLASIGLDINSPTLLVGAMLISPLMVPMLGIGVFYATNDLPNLKQSSQKMLIAIAVSLFTSLIYFVLTPFGELTEEIMLRTKPTLIDALIAFIGGVVGIISISRKEQITVLPGVAVAITLMPPICTMGYSISQFNLEIFSGAFYLFLINALVIIFVSSFATRRLGFPLKKGVSKFRKKIQRTIAWVGIIVLLSPGTYLLNEIISNNEQQEKVEHFIREKITPVGDILKWDHVKTDSTNKVRVFLLEDILSKDSIYCIEESFKELGLNNAELEIIQPKVNLENKIIKVIDSIAVEKKVKDTLPNDLNKNIKTIFPEVKSIQKVFSDSDQLAFRIEWSGFDLLVPHRKKKLDGIKRYIESQYDTTVSVYQ